LSTDTAPDFDLGPLTWVQGEIDQALSRGLESLAAYKASPSEVTTLKQARAPRDPTPGTEDVQTHASQPAFT
jgi:chemosensory pili system protein ChpA (sensor histidine kinase/response regulator)